MLKLVEETILALPPTFILIGRRKFKWGLNSASVVELKEEKLSSVSMMSVTILNLASICILLGASSVSKFRSNANSIPSRTRCTTTSVLLAIQTGDKSGLCTVRVASGDDNGLKVVDRSIQAILVQHLLNSLCRLEVNVFKPRSIKF